MTPNELLTLERRISAERFAPYRAATGDDPKQAIKLYERNTELSAAFWAVLSDLEILVRNAMHEKLTAWSLAMYGQAAWYMDHGEIFNEQTTSDINTARRHATAGGRPEAPGRVVAELPLGFWRFLLSSRYERSLWLPDLHLQRNRIAHHEPIHNRPLTRLHSQTLITAGWVCPITRQWIAALSRIPVLLSDMASPGN